MMLSSLALAVAALLPAQSFSNPIHLHPHIKVQDGRISLQIVNPTVGFRDLIIDGHTYTIASHHSVAIKAPAGTVIYCASRGYSHKRGDILLTLTPGQNHSLLQLD